MNPQESRAKLLAQKQAQKDEVERAKQIHDEAKQATKLLIMLGYNFEDIFELATPKVSESYLTEMFRSAGYFRKRKRADMRNSVFGAPRWLDYPSDMVIDFDSDNNSDAENDSLSTSKSVKSVEKAEPAQPVSQAVTESPSEIEHDREDAEKAAADPEYVHVEGENNGEIESPQSTDQSENKLEQNYEQMNTEIAEHIELPTTSSQEHSSSVVNDKSQPLHRKVDAAQPEIVSGTQDSQPKATNNTELVQDVDMILNDGDEKVENENTQDFREVATQKPVNNEAGDTTQFYSFVDHGDNSDDQVDANQGRDTTQNPDTAHDQDTTQTKNMSQDQHIIHGHDSSIDQEMDVNMDNTEDFDTQSAVNSVNEELSKTEQEVKNLEAVKSSEDPQTSEDDIRKESERVQAEILEIQNRQLKLVKLRRTTKLREIASKRTLLVQARQAVNMNKATKRVAKLESQLVEAKALMIQAAQRLKQIDEDSKLLDKEELEIRHQVESEKNASNAQKPVKSEQASHLESAEEAAAAEEEDVEKTSYIPPTVESSPSRMFSSFRMCPSLKPKYWFAPTFNARFVRDLQDRCFCSTELRKGSCKKRDCRDVHFAEFQIPGSVVCQYMASRELDEPGFRAGLIDAVETHLKSPEVPVENLAATIIGYRRMQDPTKFLDWGDVQRPF